MTFFKKKLIKYSFIFFIEAELFTFTIQVENNGPSDATNVAVQLSNTKSYGVRSAIYNKDVEVSFMILKIDFYQKTTFISITNIDCNGSIRCMAHSRVACW